MSFTNYWCTAYVNKRRRISIIRYSKYIQYFKVFWFESLKDVKQYGEAGMKFYLLDNYICGAHQQKDNFLCGGSS